MNHSFNSGPPKLGDPTSTINFMHHIPPQSQTHLGFQVLPATPNSPFDPNSGPIFAENLANATQTQQQWSQNIPSVMPWSTPVGDSCQQTRDNFSFTSMPSTPQPINNSATPICDKSPIPKCDPSFILNSSTPRRTNKRGYNYSMDDPSEFDFDSGRPIKKYVCEDKVLEIFDRLHIREGDHYIVEDVVDNPKLVKNQSQNSIYIEEIESDDLKLELSPELKDAFQNQPSSITDRLVQAERDKLSKAVTIWKPNNIIRLLSNNVVQNDSDDEGNHEVKIDEVVSDEEFDMEELDPDRLQIEPLNEIQDQFME